ncbi:hypothetical protein [Pseudogemmobacter sp. W21_MBD1_M6]|uniref:hypothetical protein n=1 Tax=Pseudogemmobacter sp. W21_MBD1_M6 TaxID=3240271 RepID=UPI003F98E1A4
MDSDLYLVVGIVIAGFAIPSIVGAYSEGRAPRVAAIMVVIAGGMIAYGVSLKPSGYRISDVPSAFVHVIGRFIR